MQQISTEIKNNRHYGIDLLRTLSMFMVLILHILGAGGVLGGVGNRPGLHFGAAFFLESCAYCAVNCYALISGYIAINGKYKYSNLVMLWLQVVLYMVLGNLLWCVLFPGSTDIKTVIKSFSPFLRDYYWYFTAYFCMYFFIPLMNRAVNALSRKQAAAVCLFVFLFFSVVRTYQRRDMVFQLNDGYSVLWLSLLYIVGACIRKHDLMKNTPALLLLGGYFACAAITLAAKWFILTTPIPVIKDNIHCDILLSYTSPTVFLSAVFLLVLCSKYPRLPKYLEKPVSSLAPVSFGVYIIHTHPRFYALIFRERGFAAYASCSALGMVGAVLLTAVVIYGICALIDSLRIRLFQILRLRERLNQLETKLIGDFWNPEKEHGK